MSMSSITAVGAAWLIVALCATAASARPSVCDRIRAPVEQALCSDPKLARLHAGVTSAYRDALRRVRPSTARASLRREHEIFLASREVVHADPGASLQRYYASWLRWLRAVDGPRRRWEGVWIMSEGDIEIAPASQGRHRVMVRADDPIRGSYTCAFTGIGQSRGDRMAVVWDTKSGTEEDGAEGWTLQLRRSRGVLDLREHRNGSEAERPPYCGARGSLAGRFLPARTRPDPVTAVGRVGD